MMAHDALPDGEWLSATDIAERSRGRVKPGTVRTWWRDGLLDYEDFPNLGLKSTKRSRSDVVDKYLRLRGFEPITDPSDLSAPPPPASNPQAPAPNSGEVMAAFLSVKASADAAIDAVIVEAESAADAAVKRVETLKNLRNAMRGYDMAITALLQTPPGSQTPNG